MKYKICKDCGKRAKVGNICDFCKEFYCEGNCDQQHAIEHMTHWEAD